MAKKSHSKSDKGVDSFENQKGKNSTDNEKDENPGQTTGEPGRGNRYLKQLVANSGFILIIVDEGGEILLYDTLYDRVLGYKHEEIAGTEIWSYIHPDDSHSVKGNITKAFTYKGEAVSFEFRFKKSDDSWCYVECFARQGENALHGNCVYLNIWDITKHNVLLKELESQLALARQLGNIGIWEWDAVNDFFVCTDELGEIFGLEKNEYPKTLSEFLGFFHPDGRQEAERLIKESAESKEEFEYKFRIRRPDGEVRFIDGAGEVVDDGNGAVKTIGAIRDLTDIKKTGQKLDSFDKKLKKMAGQQEMVLENERIRIAREIHDELGQMLTVLKIDLSLAIKQGKKENKDTFKTKFEDDLALVKERIDTIIESVQRIATELRPEILVDFGLVEAIEWQANEFEQRTGIKLGLTDEQSSFNLLDKKQSTAVFRIFQEILTNIMRYSNATSVDVQLKEDGQKLVLKVSDDGKGIKPEELKSLDSLGIIGMRERSDILGGSIVFKGEEGKGTVVTLQIPFAGKSQFKGRGARKLPAHLPGEGIINIVVADDHPLVCEGLKKILMEESDDLRVTNVAESGESLLNILEEGLPHLVILDIAMPGMHGLYTLKELHKLYPGLPVLVLSIHPEQRYGERAMNAGAAGYLNKSVVAEELVATIRKIVKQKSY